MSSLAEDVRRELQTCEDELIQINLQIARLKGQRDEMENRRTIMKGLLEVVK